MDRPPFSDDTKFLNVLQVVALDMVASIGLFVVGLSSGLSWPMALLLAWIGGVFLTIAGLGCVYLYMLRGDSCSVAQCGPALVPRNITDPLQLWETDRLLELEHVGAEAPAVVQTDKHLTPGAMNGSIHSDGIETDIENERKQSNAR